MNLNWLNDPQHLSSVIRAIIVIIFGIPFVYLISRVLGRICSRKFSQHIGLLINKLVLYFGCILVIITVMLDLDFNLTAVLGTAGIASVAVGFAAQASLSNVISGLFLLGEKPFEIGDQILVDKQRGFVLSIDLLSVKIRTFENLYVRIPNETIIKTDLINVTRFPIRRLDMIIKIGYEEDTRKVLEILKQIASENPYSLMEPEPFLMVKDLGESYWNVKFGVWGQQSDYINLRNSIYLDIRERFSQEGINIPVPKLQLVNNENLVSAKH